MVTVFFTTLIGLYLGLATLIGFAKFRKNLAMMVPLVSGIISGFLCPIMLLAPAPFVKWWFLALLIVAFSFVYGSCKGKDWGKVATVFVISFLVSVFFGGVLLFLAFAYWLIGGPGLL